MNQIKLIEKLLLLIKLYSFILIEWLDMIHLFKYKINFYKHNNNLHHQLYLLHMLICLVELLLKQNHNKHLLIKIIVLKVVVYIFIIKICIHIINNNIQPKLHLLLVNILNKIILMLFQM